MYPPPPTLTTTRDFANNVEQTQLEHYKKNDGQCFTNETKPNNNSMIELKNTNEALEKEKAADTAHAGSFYGLPPEHILEFQRIAWEVSGMRLTYAEAWECGHTLTNFFNILIRSEDITEDK